VRSEFGRQLRGNCGKRSTLALDTTALMRQQYDEIWQRKDFAAIDRWVSPNVIDHMPMPGLGCDFDGHKQAVMSVLLAFPDADFTIEDVISEGDVAVGRWSMRGTHSGELLGVPPTGKQVRMTGMDMIRFEDGLIAEVWHIEDILGMLQQVGVLPPA
jgi:steroid delta-isomerase-like uncharacterized protein